MTKLLSGKRLNPGIFGALLLTALFMAFSPASTSAAVCQFNPPAGLPACNDGCYVPTPGPSGGGPLDYWSCVPNVPTPPGGTLSFSPASVKNGAGFTISLSGGPASVAPTHLLINTSDNDESHYGANFTDFGPFDSARTNASGNFSLSRTMNCAAYTSYTPGQSVNLSAGAGKKIYQQVKVQWPDGSFSSVANHIKDCGAPITPDVIPLASSTTASSCTLSGSVKEFDAFPLQPYPGYYSAYYTAFYAGSGGFLPYNSGSRLLHPTPFGYTVIDISDRSNPQSLMYEDYRVAQGYPLGGPIACPGDCHGSIGSVAVSADGQRAIFGLSANGQGKSMPYGVGAMVGQPFGGGYGFRLMGGSPAKGEHLLQKVGDKYFAYTLTYGGGGVYVSDVTTLPRDGLAAITAEDGKGNILNPIPYSKAPSLPSGYSATLSGYWITYMNGSTIYLVNASSPLPASDLTAKQFTAADFGRPSDSPYVFSAAQDPSNPAAVYILGEFASTTPAYYAPYVVDPRWPMGMKYVPATRTETGYTLIRVLGGVPTIVGSFSPSTGETYMSANLAADNAGNLFAFMKVRTPAGAYRQYSSSVRTFGATPGFFDVTTPDQWSGSTFVAGTEPGQIYDYYHSNNAMSQVIPMTCTATPVVQHKSCVSNACTLVDGSGVDSCSANADCTSGGGGGGTPPDGGGPAGSCDFTLTPNPTSLTATVPTGWSSYVSYTLSATKPADPTCPAVTVTVPTLKDTSGNTVATPLSGTLTIAPGGSNVAIFNVQNVPGTYQIPIKAYGRGVQKTVNLNLIVE